METKTLVMNAKKSWRKKILKQKMPNRFPLKYF